MIRIIPFLLILSSCAPQSSLTKKDNVYFFNNSEQIVVSFSSKQISQEILNNTADMISFLWKNIPSSLKKEEFFIEGLSGNRFADFFQIGNYFFFSSAQFQNKMLIYGYLAQLFQQFQQKQQLPTVIPIEDFYSLVQKEPLSKKDFDLLMKLSVQESVKDIFFVSILELLERPEAYFYPSNVQTELFRALVFPEILTFWNYMENRFGRKKLLLFAQEKYTPENFHITFGEKIADLENEYVKTIEPLKPNQKLNKNNLYQEYKKILMLYLSGTKKTLMTK